MSVAPATGVYSVAPVGFSMSWTVMPCATTLPSGVFFLTVPVNVAVGGTGVSVATSFGQARLVDEWTRS